MKLIEVRKREPRRSLCRTNQTLCLTHYTNTVKHCFGKFHNLRSYIAQGRWHWNLVLNVFLVLLNEKANWVFQNVRTQMSFINQPTLGMTFSQYQHLFQRAHLQHFLSNSFLWHDCAPRTTWFSPNDTVYPAAGGFFSLQQNYVIDFIFE